jgi:hypothetical protein
MTTERWGTLSVKDHIDSQAIIADLLLYDRLVFPVISGRGERTRWRGAGWDPERQERLIEDLGEKVAVKAAWDEDRQDKFEDLRKSRKWIAEDAFQTTRRVLAMDRNLPVPEGAEVRAIAAYHDIEEGRKELGLEAAQGDQIALGKLAFVVGRKLLVPLIDPGADAGDLALRVRDLSLSDKYRADRQEFYLWQEVTVDAIAKGRTTVKKSVDELGKRADHLNGSIISYFADHWPSLTVKTALTIVGIGLPHVLGTPEAAGLLALLPGGFELVKFGAEEVMESASKDKSEAAAMLVSATRLLKK